MRAPHRAPPHDPAVEADEPNDEHRTEMPSDDLDNLHAHDDSPRQEG